MQRLCAFITIAITITITPHLAWGAIIITGMEDYTFASHTVGTGDKSLSKLSCVGKDAGNKLWKATITGSGTGGAFTLTDGTNTIPFAVTFAPARSFTSGVQEINLPSADNTVPLDCGGTDNQDFVIDILGTDLDGTPAGDYSGFIDIQVAP